MKKKILLSVVALLAVTVALGFVFKEPLRDLVYQQVTKDMFVKTDDDNFEPGVQGTQTGNTFPTVRVSYQGNELKSLMQFAKSQGLVVMFSRSAVW